RSGATREGYESSAMYLLQYELIRRLKEEGVKQLNIGGVPEGATDPSHPNHGLYNFKRYFGGVPFRRTSLKIEL
ncbi:MAG: peptidoglycan bridge formation glycyltransferase FemA/FemB family protein, partial [Minisyncoccota bacterium]